MQNNFFNAYELLDIKTNANNTEIKKAYKIKALEFHPDKYNNSKPATAMFRLVVRAKDILLNPTSRLEHDYMIGVKKKPRVVPEPEIIYINETIKETDWGAIVGAGLVGLALGVAIKRTNKVRKRKK